MVVLGYLLLMLPFLAVHHFHASAFIVAGRYFVDAAHTPSRIQIGNGFGYDGQFYYRMAVAPFSFERVRAGVWFDAPTYRMGRIVYPLLVWVVTVGQPKLVPAAMFAVNLLGLGMIGGLSTVLARDFDLSRLTAPAIVLWAGFVGTLTHDTTEITAAAFLLAAILYHSRRHFVLFALCGAAATLARETTALTLLGLLLVDIARWREGGRAVAILCGAALLAPVVAWHEALPRLWHLPGSSGGFGQNIGWPLAGLIEALRADVARLHGWIGMRRLDLLLRLVSLFTALGIVGFCLAVTSVIGPALRRGSQTPLAVGWILTAALMTTLTAKGPWIDPVAYGRAFTEFWIGGCLLLGGARPRWPIATPAAIAFCAGMFASLVFLTAIQLGVLA